MRTAFHVSLARRHQGRVGREGPGEYWYGPAAYRAWTRHLANCDSLSEQKRNLLFTCNWWNFSTLVDARRSAVTFLRDNAHLLPPAAHAFATKAADVCRQAHTSLSSVFARHDIFLCRWGMEAMQRWTPQARQAEMNVLAEAERFDATATALLEKVFA